MWTQVFLKCRSESEKGGGERGGFEPLNSPLVCRNADDEAESREDHENGADIGNVARKARRLLRLRDRHGSRWMISTKIAMSGLLWGKSQLVDLAFGVRKLQINAVVEDDNVSTDELEELVCEIEDYVQSMDIVSWAGRPPALVWQMYAQSCRPGRLLYARAVS